MKTEDVKTNSLSKSELEVMSALWRLKSANVTAIQDEMLKSSSDKRKLAYTTIATHLKRMVEKGAVKVRKERRSYLYEPTEKRNDYQRNHLSQIVQQFFDGRPSSLASRFIESSSFTREELQELRRLIDEKIPK